MKNIHLIPTDKPSRLYTNNGTLHLDKYSRASNGITINQHIYITNDEEIKEGDWYWLEKVGEIGSNSGFYKSTTEKSSKLNTISSNCKKIILTTDGDLIKDGIQAIDVDFLEWFVKNPSCEWVEVKLDYDNGLRIIDGKNLGYYCIILKKESKQTDEPLIGFTNTNDFTSMIYNPTDEKGRVMTYWGGLEEPKQKTLEEAAEIDLTNLCYYDKRNPDCTADDEDIEYHQKSLLKKNKTCSCDNCFYGRTELTEQLILQAERMYSEEDLISFAHFYFQEEFNSTMQTSKSTDKIFNEWFEQKIKNK